MAKESVMKLYCFPPSPNTWKVRAFAHQIGVPLELEIVDLTKGAQRKPEYLALNPTGRTPTLVDDDFTLAESSAIMQYLAAKTKTPLWPDDARSRAHIVRWQSWHLQHWSRGTTGFIFENLVKGILQIGPPDQKALAQAGELFHQDAAMLDKHLGAHPYLVNDTLTLADFTVVAPLFLADAGKIPLEKYRNIRRWFGAQAALPAWQQTAPKR
jgi:glutathione S-transferase